MRASRHPSLERYIVAAAIASALLMSHAASVAARPLSQCRLGYQSDYYSIVAGTMSEATRNDLRLRVLIDALDDAEIVFSGRLVKRWYLSDVQETDIPTILEVYDRVRVLKGEMPSAAADETAYVIRERFCDGRCWLGALPEVTGAGRDETARVVLALRSSSSPPGEARDRRSGAVVYSGRIDALLGPCDPRQVDAAAAEMLIGSPGEIARLRRDYPPRTAEDKRRDEAFIIRRLMGRP